MEGFLQGDHATLVIVILWGTQRGRRRQLVPGGSSDSRALLLAARSRRFCSHMVIPWGNRNSKILKNVPVELFMKLIIAT